jgi:hypothetical protein
MRTSPSGSLYNSWTEPSYEVKVRGTMHLWGSAGITIDIAFARPLLLHIHNDVFGEDITLGRRASGTSETIGKLKPGECVSIPLNDVSGVFASCDKESTVCCLIK